MTTQRPVALVTGSAQRVGRAIVLDLAEAGFDVVVHYRLSAEAAEWTASEARTRGARAEVIRADLAAVAEIEGLMGTVAEMFGTLDLLVNNASTFYRTPFLQVDESQFDELFDSNCKGPFFCSQFAVPLLSQSENGQIIHIVDVTTERPWPDYLPYCGAKAALISFTYGMARALAPEIRVNAVAPGPVEFPESYSPAQKEKAIQKTLLKRQGSPDDIARTVTFLATGPEYVTGAVIPVDGGRALS